MKFGYATGRTIIYFGEPYWGNVLIVEVNSVYNVCSCFALCDYHVLGYADLSVSRVAYNNLKRLIW